MKLRRRVIEDRRRIEIDELYTGGGTACAVTWRRQQPRSTGKGRLAAFPLPEELQRIGADLSE